jgi:hypothetical protein
LRLVISLAVAAKERERKKEREKKKTALDLVFYEHLMESNACAFGECT